MAECASACFLQSACWCYALRLRHDNADRRCLRSSSRHRTESTPICNVLTGIRAGLCLDNLQTVNVMRLSYRYQILLLALTTFVAGANEYILAGELDLVARGLGISIGLAGQLITIYALVYGLCVPVVVALTGRIGRRTVLVAATVGYALVSGLCFFAYDFRVFVALRVLQALLGGLAVVSSLSTAAVMAGPERRGRAIATVIMGFTTSLIVAVPIGREIVLHFGWNAVFPLTAVLGLITAFIQRYALPVLTPAASIPLQEQVAMLTRPATIAGLLVTVLWMAGYTLTYSYLTPYLLNVQHVSGNWISVIFLAFGFASLIGSRLGGSFNDKLGHHATLVMLKILQAIFLVAMPAVALAWPHGSLPTITIVLMLWSITAWACTPSQQVRVAGINAKASGVLVGLNQSSIQIGIAAGSALGGVAASAFGLSWLPWLSALLEIGALMLLLALHRVKLSVRAARA
ncbi:MFS transporter [Candidimonas nitroreducens]|uniref:MFS transporter n=2 Tax=Candidimonas nitroreducens TaxID=683354 RepID=A0A225MT87_9BURK|nr:MFS transporter [Candidimonas nitroreducens]